MDVKRASKIKQLDCYFIVDFQQRFHADGNNVIRWPISHLRRRLVPFFLPFTSLGEFTRAITKTHLCRVKKREGMGVKYGDHSDYGVGIV